jgi:hypothetical protein
MTMKMKMRLVLLALLVRMLRTAYPVFEFLTNADDEQSRPSSCSERIRRIHGVNETINICCVSAASESIHTRVVVPVVGTCIIKQVISHRCKTKPRALYDLYKDSVNLFGIIIEIHMRTKDSLAASPRRKGVGDKREIQAITPAFIIRCIR